jgi:hypothetical protein
MLPLENPGIIIPSVHLLGKAWTNPPSGVDVLLVRMAKMRRMLREEEDEGRAGKAGSETRTARRRLGALQ